jgi:ribosome-associated protein
LAKLVRKKKQETPEAGSTSDFLPNSLRIGDLAAQRKAINLRAYDVRGLTVLADSFIMCSAASEPQMRAIFDSVREGMKAAGVAPLHTEGTFHGGWMVIDYGDVIFHVFREEARDFYDLDGFWGDAPEIALDSET